MFEFHEYHERFSEAVYHLIFETDKDILGHCYIGKKGKIASLPYSAPFSLLYPRKKWKLEDIIQCLEGLILFCKYLEFSKIYITLPPDIYYPSLVNTLSSCLFSKCFKVFSVDLNQYYSLENFDTVELYLSSVERMVRRNYNKAIKNDLKFVKIDKNRFEEAYNVIQINREEMGYPLKIPKNQMKNIINLEHLKSSFFLVKKKDTAIASAIVFDVTNEVSQVIYWGDNPSYRVLRPMALLSTHLFDYFKNQGKKYLDIGPSSDKGIISPGLFEFKESLNCKSTIKLTFELTL